MGSEVTAIDGATSSGDTASLQDVRTEPRTRRPPLPLPVLPRALPAIGTDAPITKAVSHTASPALANLSVPPPELQPVVVLLPTAQQKIPSSAAVLPVFVQPEFAPALAQAAPSDAAKLGAPLPPPPVSRDAMPEEPGHSVDEEAARQRLLEAPIDAGVPRSGTVIVDTVPSASTATVSPPGTLPVSPAVKSAPAPLVWIWRTWRAAVTALKIGTISLIVWLLIMLALIGLYRSSEPPGSALMTIRWLGGQPIDQTWVPISAIAPSLRRAVLVSEDGQFCRHKGFDFGEIRAAINRNEGFGRGASTISQQLAKNLFLWPDRSYIRKALEVPLTVMIETLWPKSRILEVYLNIVEWGPGIFGAEAAARAYFGKPASRLTDREAALLAVALPNPIARDASDPEPLQARLATRLQSRMRSPLTFPCIADNRPKS